MEKRKNNDNQKLKRKIKRIIKKQDTDKEIKKLQKKKPINFKKINRKNKVNLEQVGNLSKKKRIKIEMIIAILILLLLSVRVAIIQFVQGNELQEMAYIEQTLDRNINPKRGTIYDTSGKIALAVSSTVETVTVTPSNIKNMVRNDNDITHLVEFVNY